MSTAKKLHFRFDDGPHRGLAIGTANFTKLENGGFHINRLLLTSLNRVDFETDKIDAIPLEGFNVKGVQAACASPCVNFRFDSLDTQPRKLDPLSPTYNFLI